MIQEATSLHGLPLSPQQRRLWRLCPRASFHPYRSVCAVEIAGDLDLGDLQAALELVARRHEILRTSFRGLPGMAYPLQVIGDGLPRLAQLPSPLDGRPLDPLLMEWEAAATDDAASSEPLRAAVASLGAGRHLLLLGMPALCGDGASLDNLVAEVARAYADVDVDAGSAAGSPFQYADLAAWNNEILTLDEGIEGKSFWRRTVLAETSQAAPQFSRRGPGADLPADFKPRTIALTLPRGLAARAAAVADQSGAAPEVALDAVLLAVWQLLLSLLTDRPELLLGVVRGGRKYEEMVAALGPYARCLPMACAPGQGSFTSLVQRVGASLRELDDWQEYFDWDLAGGAASSTALPFVFELAEVAPPVEAGGLTFTMARRHSWSERFEVLLRVHRYRGEVTSLGADLVYDASVLDRTDVERLGRWYETLLESALAAPESRVGDLQVLDGIERQRTLVEWNATGADFGPAGTLWERIVEQAAREPHGTALEWEGGEMTRAELIDRASRLAGHLRRLGVGPEVRVGVAVERSPEMVVSLLGVLAAGGAYVPLDPEYPQERLDRMLEDSGAAVLLTRPALAGRFPEGPFRVVCLDALDLETGDRGEPGAGPDNLAYVIYTSGSTGRPKGVMISHRAILNRLLWMLQRFPLRADDRVLQKTPYSFDASVWEIFVPLISGARLLLAEPGGQRDNAYLLETIAGRGVTVLQLVPSQLSVFLEQRGIREGCAGLRRLFCGGEPLPAETARRWLEESGAGLCNLYGPTEVSIDATFHSCAEVAGDGTVPLGRPLANLRVYLVDSGNRPVPAGLPGELLVGGAGLARGYLGRPDLTAERFVPDPFGPAGERLYRTGDLARARPDGLLEYLGRRDDQVKIRGLRIEPGEVEAALLACPGVAEAAVAVHGFGAADRRLIAYVAPAPGTLQPLDGSLVAARLRESLPEPMQPSDVIVLPALPRLPSGKLDRRGLPEPTTADRRRRVELVPPRTSTERRLAVLWAELLEVDEAGALDHFFESGGHSLLATQLVSRIRETFRVELRVRDLFEEPTLGGLAKRIVALADEADGLLPPLLPVSRERERPLSFAQQRLWFLDQLSPGGADYNLAMPLRVEGRLDPARLGSALSEVVRRHEVLRTRFPAVAGRGVQVIDPPRPVGTPLVDLGALPPLTGSAEALRLAREDARRPFDLGRDELLRITVLRLDAGAAEHAVLFTLHHIVSDGWSTGVLVREMTALYEAFAAGRPSPLSELPLQYADFAYWQRGWLHGEVLEAQLSFWRGQLAGAPQVLELPLDRPRPAVHTARGAARPVTLPPAQAAAVHGLCRREGATPFMVLLAAWAALLGRLAGQEDVLLGTPIAGRNRREVEDLIGFFVNTLVMRADLSGAPGFVDLVRRVRQVALDAYAHQDVPFELLVDDLAAGRDLAHTPLFQALFALQNAPVHSLSIPGLTLAPLGVESGVVKLDLALTLAETGDRGFAGVLEYNTDLFDGSTIERLLARFDLLLAAALAEPAVVVTDLPLLLPAERQQLRVEWNDTAGEYPRGACLPDLFAAVARATPDAVALMPVDGDLWSYRRLHAAASGLARHLRSLGVGPETRVALCLARSPELIVSVLAVLAAGGAYVPLDAGYPDERLTYMLADSGARLALVDPRTRQRLEGLEGLASLVTVEEALWSEAKAESEPATVSVPAESLALVIYTSGSTGQPKGVALTHRGIVRMVRETTYARWDRQDRIAHLSNISFDAATMEIWAALLHGAALVIIPGEEALSPAGLAARVRQDGVTWMVLTTALFNQVARELPEALAPLRAVMFAGEAADPSAVARMLGGPQLLNGYGPAEGATISTWHRVRNVPPGTVTVPIGRPVANTSAYVLDRWRALAPTGTVGELFVGGDGLARGYLNRPDLTAERFVPHPWASGERLYRTGDLVRQRADGTLEFVGRGDDQVKIRGFRIEPAEIEAVLASHSEIRECAVLARQDRPGDRRLVAYAVGREGRPPRVADLRRHLRSRLPEFMIPSAFVFLDALPLTPNGKLDRQALPAPEKAGSESYAAPSDPVEELLAGIWAEVLGLESVGIHDNFFDLGGHSLLVTQVASRLRNVLRVELPLRQLFESPTIAGLALAVRAADREAAGPEAPPIISLPRGGDLPLSFAQQRLWFLDRLEPGSAAYNLPLAVRLRGAVSVPELSWIFGEIARRHEVLRTTFGSRDGRAVQIVAAFSVPPLPVVDLVGLAEDRREEQAQALALEEIRRPFDLERGPLLRLCLVRLDDRDHVLLMTLHHIISDGWSMGVLLHEIAALHERVEGRAATLPELPELPVQYADFAHWQREWLRGEVLEGQLAYWRQHLAGAPRVLELPLDRPRPARQSFRGAVRSFALAPDLAAAVRRLCRREDATPFMVLLAAWGLLLGRHTGQQDVVVGTPIAGRNRQEIENLIGFFVNTLALRVDGRGAPTFAELLGRVRVAALGGYTHQDVPFERLVDELVTDRGLAVSPLFQAVFALQNAASLGDREQDVAGAGLTLKPLVLDLGVAKFDLTLTLAERAGHGFAGTLEYNTDLFDPATSERLLDHLSTLLAGAVADPREQAWEIPLLGEVERRQLLAWSGGGEPHRAAGSLAAGFEAWAAARPDALAAVFEGAALTYGELDRRADRLARRLLDARVEPGSRVCLALERGLGLVAGIVGILKAGCAYVPLDPSYPRERLAWVLEDAAPAALVSEAATLARLPAWPGRVLLLDVEDQDPVERLRVAVGPEWPAYVIYTSGSTGRPKGVVVSHGNVLRLMGSTEERFGFGAEDVWTLFHSFAFDFSVWELWGALLYGGRLVVVPYLISRSPEAMLDLVEREAVTVLNQTPSAFQAFQHAEARREEVGARSLRWVIFGGEALEPRGLEGWWRRRAGQGLAAPGLVNMYGITETTVHVTWRRLSESEILGGGGSVIGVPLSDLRVYVLEPSGELAPVGVAGELHVGGAGVSPGYLGRPELTAERFVPDGFATQPGVRLYRSGDLGRWRSTGELEYLGRIDHQIKVRGFRIEPGEIESVLLRQAGVEAAVVMVREVTPGDRRLVAYVAGREGGTPGIEELRDRLKASLPEHMVPSAFVALPSLPLTVNGKVDRRALPAPAGERPELGAEYAAPRTLAEEVLAAIWAQVLGLGRVGIHDNFFALGGDSILSLRVVALARERGLEVELADLFEHQTIAELGLAARLAQGVPEGVRSEPLSLIREEDRRKLPEGVEDAYPLAMLQAGMLFHMGLTPEEPQYHNVDSWYVRGRFEEEAFREAVRRVVARHPLLRTSFAMTGYSEPLQLVHAVAELPLTVEDIRHLAPAEQEAAVDRLILQEKRRPFDLTRAPQLRFHVFLRAVEAFQFTLGENHAIFDGWSLHATLSEIFELYFALLSGAAPEPLPPLALTYREHVRLEREALSSPAAEEHWRRLLQGAELVELPHWPPDWCRPGQYRMERLNLPVPPAVTAGLRSLALAAAVPLKSVLLAAHFKVLSLIAGRPDVVSGVVLNGRSEESEGDQVRGLFLNTLPLRLRLPNGSWADLVRAAFEAELELLPHRRYPFAAVQRRWGDRPLFEIIFNYIRFHVVQDLMRSGHVEVLQFKQAEGGHFKLQAHFNQDLAQTSVGLGLEYDSHAVPSAMVREIGELYLQTLGSMAAEASHAHGEVSILSSAAGQKLLREWNDTAVELAGARRGLHELIEEQARRAPDRVAVAIEGESLTYRHLSRRSHQLARALRRLGVGPEVRVALCIGRSPEMVVALLGILEAGGAYVPLDPAHPAERLALVLGDSAPQVLVTEERWLELLPVPGGDAGPRILCLDRDRERIAAEDAAGLDTLPGGGPESLAYVIYTSGSTGRPKGVCLSHGAVVNFLLAMADRLGPGADVVVPALTTLTFDIAGLEIYLPLVLGGRVEVVGTEEAAEGHELMARLASAGATAMQATPATWRLLLDAGWKGQPGLEALCGGEALPRALATELLDRGAELWNVYGPTETAVWSAAGPVARAGEGASVGLGRPLANTRFHVVGPGLEPVPVGAAGELLIAGAGVARGYWGRPELTAERFLPDAWSTAGGARLYRTGDLVRHRLDGELEFLGRVDHQIKLRGFRVELGEIEAALLRHPRVSQAAVVPVGDGTDRRLVAWFTSPAEPGARPAPAGSELRELLRGWLPAYMVPAAFVPLPEMPLTPSGKVDRRALAQSALDVHAPGAERRGPRTPVEEIVAGLWAEVLGLPRVGLEDDFFQLGGHSLIATRLFSRLREALHVELPLRTLFEAPRLVDLASRVQAVLAAGGGAPAPPPLARVSRDLPLPLSFSQEGLWFIDRLHPGGTAYNIPLTVRLTGRLDVAALAQTLAEIVRRHETLRTVFAVAGDRPVQVILPQPLMALAAVDLSGLTGIGSGRQEREARRLAAELMGLPFDLARGPLLRHGLLRLGEEAHLLVMSCHHIIADAWSIDVLARELASLYEAFRAGRPSPLPELPVQYADFAAWQRDWLQGDALRALLDHWRQVVAGAPLLELPADRPRRAGQGFRGGELRAALPASVAGPLRALGRRSGATLFMTLLSGVAALLERYTGQDDVVVGSPVAGRTRTELEGLIGFFINTLALRLDLAGDPGFDRLLERVRSTCLTAYDHQDVPLEKLIAELQPARDLSRSPLFQILVQLHNAPRGEVELPGLVLSPVVPEESDAKFDLVVNGVERGEELALVLRYSADLFERATMERLADHLATLLAGAVAEPSRPLSDLPLLSEPERGQLLGGALPADPCLHHLFSARAAADPGAVALAGGGERLTYGELEARANQLARFLVGRGVGPGVLVGLCLERSFELVIAILGVLKAGGAYLPLDPDVPPARLAFMLEDSRVPLLLTQERLRERLPASAAGVVCLDEDEACIAQESPAPWAAQSSAGDPAYVIYTSGSTGRPKGVLIRHVNVTRLFEATAPWFGFDSTDVWTLFHSYAFDFSVWEIWGALLYGGRLVIVPYPVSRSPADFHALLASEKVTVLNQTPSAFRQLSWIDQEKEPGALALRLVIFGGEALDLQSLAPWIERYGDVRPRLVNMYGITETTVHVTYREISRADLRAGRGSMIGRPIPDLTLHVLDRRGNLLPVGVPGELYVGGAGLAQGYLARPELTAERFVPDPFAMSPTSPTSPVARLYRSGDLARRLADGDHEYLGRIDRQVKIRGFRIELGEIEAALAAYPGVREAAVLARDAAEGAEGGERRLVAYLGAAAEPEPGALRAFLGARLPDYMLPSAVVTLPSLPLTANGKLDHGALPAPEAVRASGASHREPETALEQAIAGLFREILKVGQVGADDDFFALGGSSITGAMLINRLQRELGEIVQVVVIFDHPTVARLAAYLREQHSAAVARWLPGEVQAGDLAGPAIDQVADRIDDRIDAAMVERMRQLVPPFPAMSVSATPAVKNPPALFVLAPPRSGTTLLRVMLGGHPGLFAPPELELLTFPTMADRRAAFSGRDSFWLEGLLRALKEMRGGTIEEVRAWVEEHERRGTPTLELYALLQEELAGRWLVDKTPSYALDPAVLRRAEAGFTAPRYLHLVRHPCGMIRSFEEARLEQIFFRRPHPFSRRQLAELIWLVSHQNILSFLAEVPPDRQHTLRFEELLAAPERVLGEACQFLGLEYHPDMARPYAGGSARMTDGLHAASRMLGDVKFHQHAGVDAEVAERWRAELSEADLGAPTRQVAVALGYPLGSLESGGRGAHIERGTWGPGEPLPLSFAQERLWFLDQLHPGTATYNIPVALRLLGRLDVAGLRTALSEVMRRHSVLRTTFASVEGRPVQVVGVAAPVPLPVVDLAGLPSAGREQEAHRLAEETGRRPFDLARGPLLRAALLRLGDEEHVALVEMHHIASDGWSVGVLIRELGALWPALDGPEPSPLPEPAIQYADFTLWQRAWLTPERLSANLGEWRERLAGLPPLDLPSDRPCPPLASGRGAILSFSLPPHLGARLAATGLRTGATLFMTALTGFSALLGRYAGQYDFAVGTPVAGRHHAELEDLIGFFVNTLVLRVGLEGSPGFDELLGRVRQAVLWAFAHQEVPFERLVEELQPQRDLSRPPLFQVMFALQNASSERLELPGLGLHRLDQAVTTAKFELTLSLAETPAGLAGEIEYATDLFDRATVSRLAGHFAALLAAAVDAPSSRLTDLPLLGASERQQLLLEWNDTAVFSSGDVARVHELFELQAARRPQAPAVAGQGTVLSYLELEARANRLARRLRRLGVGPETRVALCLERSPEMVVALLGILKAGGAYVPLDPAHPAERLALVLGDSAPAVLVTEERWLEQLAAHRRGDTGGTGPRTLCLDRDRESIAAEETAALDVPLSGDTESLAYVIYTSGSTGRPKGVCLPHGAVVNFLLAMAGRLGLGADDVVPALTTLTFDIAGLEIYLPLALGGRVEVVGGEEGSDGHRLAARLTAAGITAMQATPATWRLLLDAGWHGRPGFKALCGGEALPRALAAELLERGTELWNLYGPTETAVWSATGVVATAGDSAAVGLGRPIANTRLHVVDRALAPVPLGVAGELLIAGAGVARGYWGRPDLTAERFVPDPWSGSAGARLYRTGDLVRHRVDGELEFLGRIDQQIKLRGFRIELGEIELALLRHPRVSQVAVVAVGEGTDRRLVACFVSPGRPEQAPADEELQELLRERLPAYMVPAQFIPLPEMPLTPSGKIDRRALARRADDLPALAGEARALLTPVEEIVAGLWCEVLQLPRVGPDDNFFRHGGHSLSGAQVISRLRQALQVDLPLRVLFEAPTVAGMAAEIERRRTSYGAPERPAIGAFRQYRGTPPPLSFAQERFWAGRQIEARTVPSTVPMLTQLEGELDVACLRRALQEIVDRHEVLRTSFADGPEGPVQVVHPDVQVRISIVDLEQVPPGDRTPEIRHWGLLDGRTHFDYGRVPPFRLTLFRGSAREHALLFTVHHSAFDGWSQDVLTGELILLYTAFRAGRPSPLPPLTAQYQDFARWQRQTLAGETLAGQVAFWREQLQGARPVDLALGRPRPAQPTFAAGFETFLVPRELEKRLDRFAAEQCVTLFMTLLAAFEALLFHETGQDDIVVTCLFANRNQLEIEKLIGNFYAGLPLRTRLGGARTFRDLLTRVRDVTLAAHEHPDILYEPVMEGMSFLENGDRGGLSTFRLLFQLNKRLAAPASSEAPPSEAPSNEVPDFDLAFRRLPFDSGKIRLDLSLFFTQADRLSGRFKYNLDVLDPKRVLRLRDRFLEILAAAVSDPDLPLAELLPQESELMESLR